MSSGNGNTISGVPRPCAAPGPAARAAVTLAVIVAAVLAAGGGLLTIGPAASAAQTGPQQSSGSSAAVVIDSVSPQVARPHGTVTVSGTVTNESGAAMSGLSIRLRSAATPLSYRDSLASYADGALPGADTPVGTPVQLSGSLPQGATASWRVSLSVSAIGISQFGVYPLAAEAFNESGLPAGIDRTFLPFWPGTAASRLSHRLNIAWIWPLLDAPQQGTCPELTSNTLAASVAPGGRLETLLTTGSGYAASADLTWAVDPGLVQSVATMTHSYRVGGAADCTGGTAQQPSPAAVQWLSGVRAVAAGQQMFLTPYDDVDVAALTHQGLDTDLTNSYRLGAATASTLLGTPTGSSPGSGASRPGTSAAASSAITWPADGLADSSVLANLAVNGVGTVVLSSTEMPPASGLYTPDDAVASTPAATGTTMKVLLADSTLTSVLASATSAPGSSSAVSQRFLAETAMIAQESPGPARSVVIAPPRTWNPTAALAGQLLSDTVSVPWLAPHTLTALAASPVNAAQAGRQAPPDNQVSPDELSGVYLKQAGALDASVRTYKGILFQPKTRYLNELSEGVAATESAAWRGSPAANAAGAQMLEAVSGYLSAMLRKVQIVNSARATLVGSSGTLPVSIVNGLAQAIQVRLRATAPPDGRLTVTDHADLITVGAGQTTTTRLSVRSGAIGDSTIELQLLGTDGKPLPEAPVSLSVQSTQFGSTLLVIIYVALGVVVLTAIARAIRRALRDGPAGPPPGGPPGGPGPGNQDDDEEAGPEAGPGAGPVPVGGDANVERDNEHADARYPPEAPDDFADAPGWARYT